MSDESGRSMYLLDGRRVTLSDLLEAGLLKAGERVRFSRPRVGETFTAEVIETGRLRLEDGGEYRSPSRAAMVAANMRAVAGWHAWVVEGTGVTLDGLRQNLLDRALADTTGASAGPKEEVGSAAQVHEWLRTARGQAEEAVPARILVRELLALWGAEDRGDQITRIEADLANHGLATWPNFRSVTLETPVAIITAAQEAEQSSEEAAAAVVDEEDESEDRYIGLMVGNLPSALAGVESVRPTATLDEAVTKLTINDYDQLAVLSGKHHLRGAVTWRSIAQAKLDKPNPRLSDAIALAGEVSYRADLLTVLDDLRRQGFLFVRNESNEVAGIVTAADVAGRYGDMANPFILIGDLDRLLRRAIARKISVDEVVGVCNPGGERIKSYDDMAMGDYQRVLEHPTLWTKLGLPFDRATFVARIDKIRIARNAIMHFNPDPVRSDTVAHLSTINDVLRRYAR
ncbi:CBS domain-containing protein [Actinoplanes sp. NPDC051859]|uniref:restriction system modified-DNA reader domain-containing protein n=1 Tax=Actinoplanes sp. NPDC051859 TaxID=3363909 RepID=UPI0037AE9B84